MFLCVVAYAQNGHIVLLKKQIPVQYYRKDSHFIFLKRISSELQELLQEFSMIPFTLLRK